MISQLAKVATMTSPQASNLSAKQLNDQALTGMTELKDVVFPRSLTASHKRVLEWRDDITVGEFVEHPFDRYDVPRGDLFRMKNFCSARLKLYSRQPQEDKTANSPLKMFCDQL